MKKFRSELTLTVGSHKSSQFTDPRQRQTKLTVLGSYDRSSWAKYEDRKTNNMQQLDVYY